VEYLKELMTQNEQLAATAKLAEKSANALSVLQNQIAVLEKENAFLRAQIIQFGIDAAASGSQGSGEYSYFRGRGGHRDPPSRLISLECLSIQRIIVLKHRNVSNFSLLKKYESCIKCWNTE
jgi:hypothetical protein